MSDLDAAPSDPFEEEPEHDIAAVEGFIDSQRTLLDEDLSEL
jgi:hypothetical protein